MQSQDKPIQYIKSPSGEKIHLKTCYEVKHSIKPFIYPKPRIGSGKLAYTKDGQYIICPFKDGYTIVDNEGKIVHEIQEFEDTVLALCVVEVDVESDKLLDKLRVFSGWQSTLIRLYIGANETPDKIWKVSSGFVVSLDFANGRFLLASTHNDHKLRVWGGREDGSFKQMGNEVGLGSLSQSVRWHPHVDWFLLFTWGSFRDVAIWRYKDDGNIISLGKLEGHLNLLTDLTFHPTISSIIYTSGRDGVIIQWEISYETAEHSRTRLLTLHHSLEALCVGPIIDDNWHLFTASFLGEIFVVNPSTWKTVSTILPYGRKFEPTKSQQDPPASLSVSQLYGTIDCVYIVNHEHTFHVIDPRDFTVSDHLVGCIDEILSLCLLKGNQLGIAANSEMIRIYQPLSETEFGQFGRCSLLCGHKDMVLSIDANRDGDRFVSGSKDQDILIWQMIGKSWAKVAIGKGHAHNVNSVAFSRQSDNFVVSTGSDLTVKVWDLTNVTEPFEKVVKISTIWTRAGHTKDIITTDVAPNDHYIATGSQDKSVIIWDASKGEQVCTFSGHKKAVWCVKFSPFDQCLASASADMTIKVWNLSNFDCMRTFHGHTSSILQLAFITRGAQLVSCSSEGILKIWTIKSMGCELTLDLHHDKVWGLVSLEDGRYLISGSSDSTVHISYDMTVEKHEIKMKEENELILREQDLDNLIHAKDYEHAVKLALDMPRKLLSILEKILISVNGDEILTRVIMSMDISELSTLFPHLVKWNTNTKFYMVTQRVLYIIFTNVPDEKMQQIAGLKKHMDAMKPYSQRHIERIDKLVQESYLFDYILQQMKLQDLELK